MKKWSVLAVLFVAGCAAGPGSDDGLMPAERPAPALAEVPEPAAGVIATERIVVETDAGLDGLVRAIGQFVAPGTWGPEHGTAMYADGNAIVVRHSPEAREAVRAALRAMAGAEGRVATVTARLFTLDADDLATLASASAADGGVVDVYDAEALEAVIAGWKKRPSTTVVCAPKLTLLAGQAGSITIANQVAYIRGFERQTAGTDSVWDAVVGSVNSGFTMGVAVIPNGPGSQDMLLHFSIESQRLFDAAGEMPVLRQGTRTTELPRLSGCRIASTVPLHPGQAIVAIGAEPPSADGDGKLMAVVIEAQWEK